MSIYKIIDEYILMNDAVELLNKEKETIYDKVKRLILCENFEILRNYLSEELNLNINLPNRRKLLLFPVKKDEMKLIVDIEKNEAYCSEMEYGVIDCGFYVDFDDFVSLINDKLDDDGYPLLNDEEKDYLEEKFEEIVNEQLRINL